jgi:hypothetical protein
LDYDFFKGEGGRRRKINSQFFFTKLDLMKKIVVSIFWLCAAGLFAQNLGINTSTPSAALDVQSQGNSGQTRAFSVSNSNNDTLLLLRDDGRLGIGTTAPTAPLDVNTSGSVAARFSAPVEGQPAVNTNELVTLGQLQAVSAGGQSSSNYGSNATMWSTSVSPSGAWHASALLFCRNLTEGGFNDWRLPTMADIFQLYADSSVPLPTYPIDAYWLVPTNFVNASTSVMPYLSLSQSSLSSNNPFTYGQNGSTANYRAFCVR